VSVSQLNADILLGVCININHTVHQGQDMNAASGVFPSGDQ